MDSRMYKLCSTFLSALVLGLAGCSTHSDIKTDTVVDPKTNMKGYKSFAWLGSISALRDPNRQWTPVGFDIQGRNYL